MHTKTEHFCFEQSFNASFQTHIGYEQHPAEGHFSTTYDESQELAEPTGYLASGSPLFRPKFLAWALAP